MKPPETNLRRQTVTHADGQWLHTGKTGPPLIFHLRFFKFGNTRGDASPAEITQPIIGNRADDVVSQTRIGIDDGEFPIPKTTSRCRRFPPQLVLVCPPRKALHKIAAETVALLKLLDHPILEATQTPPASRTRPSRPRLRNRAHVRQNQSVRACEPYELFVFVFVQTCARADPERSRCISEMRDR